jgi:hypothetical protein
MPVVSRAKSTKLIIVTEAGIDDKGKLLLKRATYGNVRTSASDQDILDTAEALSQLFKSPVVEYERSTVNELVKE